MFLLQWLLLLLSVFQFLPLSSDKALVTVSKVVGPKLQPKPNYTHIVQMEVFGICSPSRCWSSLLKWGGQCCFRVIFGMFRACCQSFQAMLRLYVCVCVEQRTAWHLVLSMGTDKHRCSRIGWGREGRLGYVGGQRGPRQVALAFVVCKCMHVRMPFNRYCACTAHVQARMGAGQALEKDNTQRHKTTKMQQFSFFPTKVTQS